MNIYLRVVISQRLARSLINTRSYLTVPFCTRSYFRALSYSPFLREPGRCVKLVQAIDLYLDLVMLLQQMFTLTF